MDELLLKRPTTVRLHLYLRLSLCIPIDGVAVDGWMRGRVDGWMGGWIDATIITCTNPRSHINPKPNTPTPVHPSTPLTRPTYPKPRPQANGEEENDLWIVSTPNPYEWAFGDTVTYALESPTVAIDESKVTWRIVNGAWSA